MNGERKVEMKTKNKLITDFSVEHDMSIKGNIVDLKKINKVRKCKRVMLPCKTVWNENEFISIRNAFSRGE